MGDCLMFLHRFFMFLFGIILVAAGTAGLVAGVWMTVSPTSIPVALRVGDAELQELVSYSLMAAGPLVVLGLLGCFAAGKNSRCLRILFFVSALAAVGTQAAGLAFALGFPEELADLLGPEAAGLMEEKKTLILSVTSTVAALEVFSMYSSMRLCCIDRKRRNNSVLPVTASRRNSSPVRGTTSGRWSNLKKLSLQLRVLCKVLCFCKCLLIVVVPALLMWAMFKSEPSRGELRY